jgi:hypothetical protein
MGARARAAASATDWLHAGATGEIVTAMVVKGLSDTEGTRLWRNLIVATRDLGQLRFTAAAGEPSGDKTSP